MVGLAAFRGPKHVGDFPNATAGENVLYVGHEKRGPVLRGKGLDSREQPVKVNRLRGSARGYLTTWGGWERLRAGAPGKLILRLKGVVVVEARAVTDQGAGRLDGLTDRVNSIIILGPGIVGIRHISWGGTGVDPLLHNPLREIRSRLELSDDL